MSSCLDSGVDFTWSKMKPLAGERNRREVLSAKLDGFNDCVSAMSPSDLACLPPEELDKALLALIILYQSTSAGGAIDNKIEQAMDLVKSHLLFAVREEVEVLKVQIKELAEKNEQLQRENTMLRQNHGPPQGTAIAQASQPQGAPMGMQQTIPQQQPTPHPQAIPQQQYTTTGGAQGQTLPPPQQGQTLPPPQGQLQGAPSISLPQQGIPQQQAAPHPQGMPQQQPTAQLQMQQPAPHLQQPTSQSIPMQQQQPQHSIPGTQQTGLSQAQHGVAPSQSQHGVAPSQQPVQHSQQQPPPPNT